MPTRLPGSPLPSVLLTIWESAEADGERSTIRVTISAALVSSVTAAEKSRRHCWDSAKIVVVGDLRVAATTNVGSSAADSIEVGDPLCPFGAVT